MAQEIFGVNSHVRSVCRQYAEMGYVAWAVGYFDHIEPGIELGYTAVDMPFGMDYKTRIGWDVPLRDDELAAEMLRKTLPAAHNKIAFVGYCWGGSMAWLTSSRQSQIFAASIGYYGGNILSMPEDSPKGPLILHFGRKDTHIPADKVEELAKKHPSVPVYLYDADHGFNCNMRGSFDEAASKLAFERTLEFMKKHVG